MALKKNPARPTSYVSLDETSRALLDSSVEAAYIMDVTGFVLAANDAAAKLFGMRKGRDLEQTDIYSHLPEDAAESRRARIESVISSARSVRFEEEMDDRALVHSIVPVPNPWGEISRLAVSILDLTELRRTDEDLRREQQRQIFFMESLPGIVYHLYPDKTIRYANRYFRKYFGSPRDAIATTRCTVPPMPAPAVRPWRQWRWTGPWSGIGPTPRGAPFTCSAAP